MLTETRAPLRSLTFALGILSVATVLRAQAPDTVHIDPNASSKVWIEGGSNVRNWSCRATTFEARALLDAPSASRPAGPSVTRVSLKLNVRDLKCGNRKMERDLYAALKATDEANPSYIIAVFNAVPDANDAAVIATHGALSVAGVEKEVKVLIAIERLPDGSLRATGNVPLRMTDFGVKPPTGLMGLIRSKNEIIVKFELLIPGPES